MIQAEKITKKFGPITAISGISLSVKPGEIVGLLGHNGAGKTTTMRILTGYMPPTSGSVRVGDYDLLQHPQEAKRLIGYLPEIPPLYSELTVEESLCFVADLYALNPPARFVSEALERTGLGHVRHRLIGNLSKGYRQRVGLAQAIVHQPPILILDEPTIGLDPKQIIEIRELLLHLKDNRVILLSSHILQEVSAVCDRVVILNKGQVIADGSLDQLSQNLQRKKLLVQVSGDPALIKKQIETIPGVNGVEEHGSDLEEIFLSLTA